MSCRALDGDLDGRTDSVKGRIRNSFEVIADAPVSKFTLEMAGGSKGLLQNSTNLCNSTNRAISDFTAHNGKVEDFRPAVGAKCPKSHKKGKKGKRGGGHRR